MTTVHAIKIKGLGKDENGINRYVWATESQFKGIVSRLASDEHKNDKVVLNGQIIRLDDILGSKPMELEYAKGLPSFNNRVVETLKIEKSEAAKLKDPEGRSRYEALKASHKFGVKVS